MNKRYIFFICTIITMTSQATNAQQIKKMEFKNQPIVDILLSLANLSGTSIIPDETVSGNASFFFSDSEFNDILLRFLSNNKLYMRKSLNTYYISRIYIAYDKDSDTINLKADEVDTQLLLKTVSNAIGKTILSDGFPKGNLTINMERVPVGDVIDILIKKYPDFKLEKNPAYFYIKKNPVDRRDSQTVTPKSRSIQKTGDSYSITLDKGKLIDVINELFSLSGKEYSILNKSDASLENIYFSNKSFDNLLRLVLEQAEADFSINNGIYYIVDIQKKDIAKKLKENIIISLKYIPVQDLIALLPSDATGSISIKPDKSNNSLLISGRIEEISQLLNIVNQIDKPTEGLKYVRFNTKYTKTKDLIPLIPSKLLTITPIILPGDSSFIALISSESQKSLQDFIDIVDTKSEGFPITLRYIKSEDLLKNLPPSVTKDDLTETGISALIFFNGSEDKRKIFQRELSIIDRPKAQIRYDLLVVQYQKSSNFTWTKTLEAAGDSSNINSLSGNLTSLLSLSFDVVSELGMGYAANLNLALEDTKANIFADTTLNGISGQELKFQNTNTYRYVETVTDTSSSTTTYTGTTKEITSGLILSITGWVSGDGMVTMTVNTTISKQGTVSSDSATNIPPTSEKVVTTQVRTESGYPVVISGLLQKDKTTTIDKVPFLGDIPLLGYLFKDMSETTEETEYVVYIVPHIAFEDSSQTVQASRAMEDYYIRFVKDYIHD